MNQVRSKGVDLYANVHSEHAIKLPKKGKGKHEGSEGQGKGYQINEL